MNCHWTQLERWSDWLPMGTREKERGERAWRAKEDESGVRGIREESTESD